MTLVAAYRSIDGGLLLCADREENENYARRDVDKIYEISRPQFKMFIAGAGPVPPIALANAEIERELIRAQSDGRDVMVEYRSVIESVLGTVHQQFKAMLRDWPMNLLIVVRPRILPWLPLLYWSNGSTMIPEECRAAFGTGKPMADYIADQVYEYPRLDKPNLLAVAAFIFREAHKAGSGVGENVDMRYLYGSSVSVQRIPPESVRELQDGIPPLKQTLWDHWKEHAKLPKWAAE